MKQFIFLSLFSIFLGVCFAENIQVVETYISYEDDCDMTILGTISLKICGDADCCYTPWIQGDFDPDHPDYFSGPSQLGECHDFRFMNTAVNETADAAMSMTIFHQGTDAACFDAIRVETDESNGYTCAFQHYEIDNNSWLSSDYCYLG